MVSVFPLCVKGWLYVLEFNDDTHMTDWKSLSTLTNTAWHERFCVLMEYDSKLCLFDEEPTNEDFKIPDHIGQFRLDTEMKMTNVSDSCNFIDDVSTTSSKHLDSDKNLSNSSLNQIKASKKNFKNSGLGSSRGIFWKAKSSTKINSMGKETPSDNPGQMKSVSTLKRSQSLSRLLIRKKSEDKSTQNPLNNQHNCNHNNDNYEFNNNTNTNIIKLKNKSKFALINSSVRSTNSSINQRTNKRGQTQMLTQSTGDLTVTSTRAQCLQLHKLTKDSAINDVHPSLINERMHAFSVSCMTLDRNVLQSSNVGSGTSSSVNGSLDYTCLLGPRGSIDSNSNKILSNNYNYYSSVVVFAARSTLEKQCWMKRFQKTLKPNLENENRFNNSLRLTIFESKCLPSQKRRYYCEVSLDKNLYARTTVKYSNNEGSVFWAEDLILDNIPTFKQLSVSLYKEPDLTKDGKKRKKKKNECIGSAQFTLNNLNNKSNDWQAWFNLKSPDLLQTESNVQLRLKLRYQSLRVLPYENYKKLANLATENHVDLINFLEQNLPIKLKEEIAICLVNIHEKKGSIVDFLTNLIIEEINNTENSSMSLRANTIVTKIIESHMKLVGFNYLHNMLCSLIREIMAQNVDLEVDPMKLETGTSLGPEEKNKLIMDNQHKLMDYFKKIWNKIFNSQKEFPIQLKAIFTGWRQKLELRALGHQRTRSNNTAVELTTEEQTKLHSHCDLIVSGCIFLRLLCPAILSPHLFGLISHFSENPAVQRTLTLIAKSLQSLANFSMFGEKENYMLFLNGLFGEEMPRMHHFLRSISTRDPLDTPDDIEVNQCQLNKEIEYYGYTIDESVELARLHNCLVSDSIKERIAKSPKISPSEFQLPEILYEISQQVLQAKKATATMHGNYDQISTSSISSVANNIRRSSIAPLFDPFTSIVNSVQSSTSTPNNNNSQQQNNNLHNFTNRNQSPPRLGSPITQSNTAINPVTEYAEYHSSRQEDIWQLRHENSNNNNNQSPQSGSAEGIKVAPRPTVTYSSKLVTPFSKSQLPSTLTTHKARYKTNETNHQMIVGGPSLNNPRPYDQQQSSRASNNPSRTSKHHHAPGNTTNTKRQIELQPKRPAIKPLETVNLSRRSSRSSQVTATMPVALNTAEGDLSGMYCNNPLYDSSENLRHSHIGTNNRLYQSQISYSNFGNGSPTEKTTLGNNPDVFRYFSTRAKLNQIKSEGQSTHNYSDRQKELEQLRNTIIQNQQCDLKQLRSVLSRGEQSINSKNNNHHHYNHPRRNKQVSNQQPHHTTATTSTSQPHNIINTANVVPPPINTRGSSLHNIYGVTTTTGDNSNSSASYYSNNNCPDQVLDQVILDIDSNGAGLDEIQVSLRRQKLRKGKSLNKLSSSPHSSTTIIDDFIDNSYHPVTDTTTTTMLSQHQPQQHQDTTPQLSISSSHCSSSNCSSAPISGLI